MPREKLFITGATGAVGHYLVDVFGNDSSWDLYLLVRDKKRFQIDTSAYSNITLVSGDLEHIKDHHVLLKDMTMVIHAATNWCGHHEANLAAVNTLLDCLDKNNIKKMVFFSTASILGRGNQLLPEANRYGTGYIQSKYLSYLNLATSPWHNKIIHVFPTVVLSGDESHPYSHIGEGLKKIKVPMNWLRFISFDLGFHYIHCQDIALIVKYLLENEVLDQDYVLGNAYITASEFLRQISQALGKKIWFQLPIPTWFIRLVIKLFNLKVEPWAAFCIRYRHFQYSAVNCKTFGLVSKFDTVSKIIHSMKVA